MFADPVTHMTIKAIKRRLEDIRDYLTTTRQCGHTTTMLRGVENVDDAVVLIACESIKGRVKEQAPKAICVSVNTTTRLREMCKPLAVDNHAMFRLLADALGAISRLEGQIERLEGQIERLKDDKLTVTPREENR